MHPMEPDHIHEELELMLPDFTTYNIEHMRHTTRNLAYSIYAKRTDATKDDMASKNAKLGLLFLDMKRSAQKIGELI